MYKEMKIDIKKRFKGYLLLPRSFSWFFMKRSLKKGIDFGLFGAYLSFVVQADWYDKRSTYGFLPPDVVLAKIWRVSQSTISRRREQLVKLGLIIEDEGGHRIKHINFFKPLHAREIAKKEFANEQQFFAEIEAINADTESMRADLQESQLQKTPQSFSNSFKSDLGSFDDEDTDYWLSKEGDSKKKCSR